MPLAAGDKIKEEEIKAIGREEEEEGKKKFPFNPKSILLNIAMNDSHDELVSSLLT